jgi:hypothetical protein
MQKKKRFYLIDNKPNHRHTDNQSIWTYGKNMQMHMNPNPIYD